MLLRVRDGEGQPQTMIVPGQETVNKHDGALADALAHDAIPANPDRSGYFFQNRGNADMYVNDQAAAVADGTSFKVAPGGTWPPAGYPVTTGAISVIGTQGDAYIARDW